MTTPKIPSRKQVDGWNASLLYHHFPFLSHLRDRGIPLSVIEEYNLGWDADGDPARIKIPIFDADGNVVNVRRYKPNHRPSDDKLLNTLGFGSPTRLYPLSVLDKSADDGYYDEWIVVGGGEMDVLAAIAQGIRAVCGTNGERSVPQGEHLEPLRGARVAITLDADKPGRIAANKWAEALTGVASETRIVALPREGMDLNDWFVEERGSGELMRLIEASPVFGAGIQRDAGELLTMALEKVSGGDSRNQTGLWLACQLRDERYSAEEAWETALSGFQEAVEHAKEDPYSIREARTTLASAYSSPPRRPSGKGVSGSGRGYEFPNTEVGNAERFYALHGGDARYIPPFDRWLIWDSRRWANDERGEVKRWAKQTTRDIRTSAFEIEDEDEQKWQLSWARRSETSAKITAMLKLAQTEPEISMLPAEFDTDPMLLNCKNGTLDLCTGQLRPHRRDDHLRRIVDIDYDPAATAPMFDAFLTQIQPDAQMREFLQRAVGYSLTGRTDEQKFLLLHGTGANGKSTLIELLHDLLGSYASSLPAESLAQKRGESIPNDIARLDGARYVSVMEFEDSGSLNERLIKQLTGGDTVQARFLRQEFFDFRPQCTLWVSSNHRPVVKGADDGIWRRFLLVNFPVRIAKSDIDPTLHQRISASELPGILVWAVEGALAWQGEGLNPPTSVLVATEGYRADSDLLGAFLDEECVVEPTETIAKGLVYARYKAWCEDGNLRPATKIAFGRMLRERPDLELTGAEVGKYKVHSWFGVGLREHRNFLRLSDDNVTPIHGGSDGRLDGGSDGKSGSEPAGQSESAGQPPAKSDRTPRRGK